MPKIEGVFFDLYGTLVNVGHFPTLWTAWLSSLHRSLLDLEHSISIDRVSVLCQDFFGRREPSEVTGDGLTVFERRVRRLLQEVGVRSPDSGAKEVAAAAIKTWLSNVALDPDAIDVLRRLRGRVKIGLITNFDHPPHVHEVLAQFALADYFDIRIISGEVGVKKPAAQIFELALTQTGLAPDKVVHVGDSIEDIQGALNSGITPIALLPKELDRVFSSPDYSSSPSPPLDFARGDGSSLKIIRRLREVEQFV